METSMNLLWMCNIELPMISEALKKSVSSSGGWMDILSRKVISDEHNLHLIYPQEGIKKFSTSNIDQVTVHQIPHTRRNNSHYDKSYEAIFNKILKENKYDSIHIWGCEFPRTLAMLRACMELDLLDKTILEIQGIKHFISRNYYASLPGRVIWSTSLNDIYFRNGIRRAKNLYESAGQYELQAIKTAINIMGRTDWDYACSKSINPSVKYYKCNRVLRKSFYNQKWEIEKCERNSIFVSSYGTPIKGLHYVLEALPIILQEYPDTHLYIVGLFRYNSKPSIWEKLKLNGYGRYIYGMIKKYNLQDKVTFLGRLNEADMRKRFINSHVYISASSIENSPNTVAESMALGVPVVSSLVGGVSSMVTHGKEGYLYQYDAPYMMAYYVKEIFKSNELACYLSENARERAKQTHDIDTNYYCLLKTYQSLSDKRN